MREKPRSIAAIAMLVVIAPGVAAAALGLAACNAEPTCDKAADRVLELIDEQNQKMLAKFPESQRKQLAEMTAKSLPRERLVQDCKDGFTPAQIACTVAAKTLEEASKCNQAAVPTGGQPAPGAAQPAPGATPGAEGATGATTGATGAAPQEPAAGEPAPPGQPAQPQ
jgi:hypothetical protein